MTEENAPVDELEVAIALACQAHRGQVDKAGEPYVLHPLRIMLRLRTQRERVIAVLHDVVEDSELTLDDLRARGFSQDVIAAVDCLTHRPDESYDAFIERVCVNELARRVKIEDIRDNLDVTRLRVITDRDRLRFEKYHRALHTLNAAR